MITLKQATSLSLLSLLVISFSVSAAPAATMPDSRVVAGNADQNEFFILGKHDPDPVTIKPTSASQPAVGIKPQAHHVKKTGIATRMAMKKHHHHRHHSIVV
ncbi:MAG TPA: hypothetical protein VNC84_00900 [Gammaproteobacteria bacterium]|jgi:hypothetical protein|nr:hypothetical protein [Gammaproteobacteria bacterium]